MKKANRQARRKSLQRGGRHNVVHVVLMDADGFDEASKESSDLVVINISRSEVERGHVGDVVDRLMRLSDSESNIRKFASKMLVVFDGYNEDVREIHEIPECVAFFRKVHQHWSLWYHFMHKHPDNFGMILKMLCDVERVALSGGITGHAFKDDDQLQRNLLDLFNPMNRLYEMYGFTHQENVSMSDEVTTAVREILKG